MCLNTIDGIRILLQFIGALTSCKPPLYLDPLKQWKAKANRKNIGARVGWPIVTDPHFIPCCQVKAGAKRFLFTLPKLESIYIKCSPIEAPYALRGYSVDNTVNSTRSPWGLCNPSYWDGGIWGWLEDVNPPWRLLVSLGRLHLS